MLEQRLSSKYSYENPSHGKLPRSKLPWSFWFSRCYLQHRRRYSLYSSSWLYSCAYSNSWLSCTCLTWLSSCNSLRNSFNRSPVRRVNPCFSFNKFLIISPTTGAFPAGPTLGSTVKATCSPTYLELTMNCVPESSSLLSKSKIPLVCVVQPLAHPQSPAVTKHFSVFLLNF